MTTKSLTEGNHNIQVTLTDYDTLNAVIDVTADGVLCVSVAGDGACGGSGLPRVEVSGMGVKIYLKKAAATPGYDAWLAGKGGLDNITLPDIFELKDKIIGLPSDLTFIPTMPQLMECKDAFIGL